MCAIRDRICILHDSRCKDIMLALHRSSFNDYFCKRVYFKGPIANKCSFMVLWSRACECLIHSWDQFFDNNILFTIVELVINRI